MMVDAPILKEGQSISKTPPGHQSLDPPSDSMSYPSYFIDRLRSIPGHHHDLQRWKRGDCRAWSPNLRKFQILGEMVDSGGRIARFTGPCWRFLWTNFDFFFWGGCSRQTHWMERMQIKRWSGSIGLEKNLMDVLSFASADGIRWVVSWALPGDWSSAWSHGRCVPPRVPESEAWTWKKCERMWLRGGIPTLAVLGMILDVFWCAVLRIDENIIFRPLNLADLREIAKLQLKRVEKRLADRRGGPFALKSQEKRVGLSSTAFACRNITIDVTEPVPCLHFGAPIFHVPMVFPNSLMGANSRLYMPALAGGCPKHRNPACTSDRNPACTSDSCTWSYGVVGRMSSRPTPQRRKTPKPQKHPNPKTQCRVCSIPCVQAKRMSSRPHPKRRKTRKTPKP